MNFVIIKEQKNQPDKRVVLPPSACRSLLKNFPEMEIKVESSENRTFTDSSYYIIGIEVTNTRKDCNVMLGVTDVKIKAFITNNKYFFF